MTPLEIYDFLCLFLSRKGRGARLMGESTPLSKTAFSRCLVGETVPFVWFEFPLLGRPCFDLHVILSQETLSRCRELPPQLVHSPFGKALAWIGTHGRGAGGAALAFDTGIGRTESHAFHILSENAANGAGIFAALDAPDKAEAFQDFLNRVPEGWRMWYFGLLPGREERPIRIDCYVDEELKARYAQSPGLFVSHLEAVGFTAVSETMLTRMKELADTPFSMELQFDILEGGIVAPVLSLSADFRSGSQQGAWRPLSKAEKQEAAKLFLRLEALGLSDDRWRLFLDSFFAKHFVFDAEEIELVHFPIFLKQKFREGIPVDAKVYSEGWGRNVLPGDSGNSCPSV